MTVCGVTESLVRIIANAFEKKLMMFLPSVPVCLRHAALIHISFD